MRKKRVRLGFEPRTSYNLDWSTQSKNSATELSNRGAGISQFEIIYSCSKTNISTN